MSTIRQSFFSLIVLCIALTVSSGCGNKSSTPISVVTSTDREIAFATVVPINDMNTSMTMEYSSDYTTNGLKIDSMIVLSVENQSQEAIILPHDNGTRLFVYSEEKANWAEVQNRVTYATSVETLLAPHGIFDPATNAIWTNIVYIIPDVPNEGKPVFVRVVVVGHIYQNGSATDKQVGAYTDIELQP